MSLTSRTRLLFLKALASVTSRPTAPKARDIHKILVMRPDHLGDLLLAAPALQHLRAGLPDAQISLLVGPWNREAAEHLPYVDQVLTIPFPWFDRTPKRSPMEPYLLLRKEAQKLQAYAFDLAIVLRFDFWWGAMLAAFAGIPHRLGYATPETIPFLTEALPYLQERHEAEQNLHLTSALLPSGAPVATTGSPIFSLSPEERAFAEHWLREHGDPGALVLIHPGAGSPVKQWQVEGFSALADQLSSEHRAAVIVTGGPSEHELVETVVAGCRTSRPLTLVGATLGQLAAVLQRSVLAVGVDSGIMHLAAALEVPTVRLYGPVDPARFGPWGPRQRVVRADLACVPCNRLDVPPEELSLHPCVHAITLASVLEAANSLMATAAVPG